MKKYNDEDLASHEAAVLLSIGLGLVICLGSVALIDNGFIIGLPIGAIGLGCLCYMWDGIRSWMHHRHLVASFKAQTRDLFVFSRGESEDEEDDTTVIERVDFARHMLALVKNPHEVTVHFVLFRDAYSFSLHTGAEGKLVRTERTVRGGLNVRETRDEYWDYVEKFRADCEQAQLMKKRDSANADDWVSSQWFNQDFQR